MQGDYWNPCHHLRAYNACSLQGSMSQVCSAMMYFRHRPSGSHAVGATSLQGLLWEYILGENQMSDDFVKHHQDDNCFICLKKGEKKHATCTVSASNHKYYRVCLDCLGTYSNIAEVITACEESGWGMVRRPCYICKSYHKPTIVKFNGKIVCSDCVWTDPELDQGRPQWLSVLSARNQSTGRLMLSVGRSL